MQAGEHKDVNKVSEDIEQIILLCETIIVFHLLQVDRPRPCTARGAEERRVTAGVGHNLGKHHVDNLTTFVNICQHHHVDNLTTGQGR